MFTGLVEALGTVLAWTPIGDGGRLAVAVRWPDDASLQAARPTREGDSVAVDGACLTVVALAAVPGGGEALTFELSHETLALTHLGDRPPGETVNLERALRLGDRLGGHFVTGHVDGQGQLAAIVERDGAWDVTYAVPAALEAELAVKGSVTVDGVSLTVNALLPGQLQVTLIPHTAAHTQLLSARPPLADAPLHRPGRRVHLETDLLAKHVRRLLQRAPDPAPAAGITVQLLERTGFLPDPLP